MWLLVLLGEEEEGAGHWVVELLLLLGLRVVLAEELGRGLLRVHVVRGEHVGRVLVLSLLEILLLLLLVEVVLLLLLLVASVHVDVDRVGSVLVQEHVLLRKLASLLQLRLALLLGGRRLESWTLKGGEGVVLLPLRLLIRLRSSVVLRFFLRSLNLGLHNGGLT